MKIILDCSEKITESINDFYGKHHLVIANERIDADQILSLFCFILANSSIPNIYSHLFIVDHFATHNQNISVSGYYSSVLACALAQL